MTGSARTQDPEQIARNIRETRADMDETVDALGQRLDPGRLKDEAQDAISSTVEDLVDKAKSAFSSSMNDAGSSLIERAKDSSIIETIQENPLPALAVGLSVAWFVSKLGESESERYRRERYEATGDSYYAPRYGSRYRSYPAYDPYDARYPDDDRYASGRSRQTGSGSSDESLADKASDALGKVKDKAGDVVDSVTDAASDVGDRAHEQALHARQQTRQYSRQSSSWMNRQMRESPLLVGAVALAGGALVGLALPETETEDELLGEQADRVKSQALDAVEKASERVTSAASDVADKAKSEAKDVADQAKKDAKDVANKAKGSAKNVASTAGKGAKETAQTAKAEAKPSGATANRPASSGKESSGSKPSSTL